MAPCDVIVVEKKHSADVKVPLRSAAALWESHLRSEGRRCVFKTHLRPSLRRCDSHKAQVTLCRSFFADVPDHSRPPRSVMIVAKPSDRGLSSRSLSVQDCQYDISTTAVRHWYDGSVWPTLSTFSTTISTITDTIDTTARTMLTTTRTFLPICYHD